MDDKETLNRRARLRELITHCFDGKASNLLAHIKENSGKEHNQPEMGAIQRDNGGKPFGDKKARNLTVMIGLHRRWFDFPLGTNLEKSKWLDDLLPSSYTEGKDSGVESAFSNVTTAPIGARPIPVISQVQAGKLREITDPYPPGAGFAIEYTDDDNLSRWAFALEIEGESMLPEFRPGDRVIIDPEIAPRAGDFVVAKNHTEEATFKKYRPRRVSENGETIFELVPLNDDYATLRSDQEPLKVIGVMVEHRKKYRRK